jgi:hypothetical protein
MTPNLGLAARTLALDLATGEVIRAFDAAHIQAIVLKGPAMAQRLYADEPGCRNYGDIDLAVAPWRFDDAGRVLAKLGFVDLLAGMRPSEAARAQERPWHRDGAAYVAVDLHRGFHSVTNRSEWWHMLVLHRETLVIEGQPVMVPDQVACALIAGLHASSADLLGKPKEDLRRALLLFDDDTWQRAAVLAQLVGGASAFAASLHAQTAGSALAARLGLEAASPRAWFKSTSLTRGSGALSLVLEDGSWVARARRLRDLTFPSPPVLARSWPVATRGALGLARAHVGRVSLILTRVPRLVLAWRRSSRTFRPPSG